MDPSTVDCGNILHLPAIISADACAGARAALRAAEIQAKATREAGRLSLWSGGAAFLAGLLAFAAAWVGLSREKRRNVVRRKAYAHLITQLSGLVNTEMLNFRDIVSSGQARPFEKLKFPHSATLVAEMNPEHFERQALLSVDSYKACSECISGINDIVRDAEAFQSPSLEIFLQQKRLLAAIDHIDIKLKKLRKLLLTSG